MLYYLASIEFSFLLINLLKLPERVTPVDAYYPFDLRLSLTS